jgi:hypothetical protein
MKLKKSQLEQIILEEITIYRKNNRLINENNAVDEALRSDSRQILGRLMDNLGAEKLLSELINRIDPKTLQEVLGTLAKLYDIRYE